MAVNLTPGAVMKMCFTSEEFQPVLQVIDLKRVQWSHNTATDRWRVVISDGEHYEQGMLASRKTELIHSGRLQKGSIIKIHQFVCNTIQDRKILIVVELDVLLRECELIGKPVPAPRASSRFAAIQAGNAPSPAIGNSPTSNVYYTSFDSPSLTLIEEVSKWHPFQ